MIAHIISFSVRARWAVLLVTLAAAAIGVWQALLLPIDVTPDITNKQVQINTVIPNLTPVEVEKRVTYPIETALTGLDGVESTRSFSRNGFSQVTAVFRVALIDDTKSHRIVIRIDEIHHEHQYKG